MQAMSTENLMTAVEEEAMLITYQKDGIAHFK